MYRPARELEEIRELESHADSFDLPALRDFAQLRRDELARAVLDSVRERDQARGVASRLMSSIDCLQGRVADAGCGRDWADRRRRRLAAVQEHLAAVIEIIDMAAPKPRAVQRVGDVAMVEPNQLRPFVASAGEILDLEFRRKLRLYEHARRFPNPEVDLPGRWKNPDDAPLSLVDRLDALQALFGPLPLLRAGLFVESGARLLGRVLRDASVLRDPLNDLPIGEGAARRHVVLALSLLGETADATMLPEHLSDEDDAATLALATVLADPHRAGDQLASWDIDAIGGALTVYEAASARYDAGLLVSVVG